MAKKFDTIVYTLVTATGLGASFTVPYPAGRSAEDYLGGTDHKINSQSYPVLSAAAGDFAVVPGASNIAITIQTGIALVDGTRLTIELDRSEQTPGQNEFADLANPDKMTFMREVKITLGAPATASANAAVLSQACTLAGGLATGINGALAAAGKATFDVPRNVVAAWTNTAVLTVTGTDEYGNVVRESSASGLALTGKKAFKTITSVTTSADITGLTVGTGVVLGLPVFLADTADVLKEILDGATATAGTLAAGVVGTQTALTGDVRGTYNPNSAPNAARVFELIVSVRNPGFKGAAQFAA